MNQRMRSLDKRWTCPVCGLALRPDDVVLHPFAQAVRFVVLSTLLPDLVSEVLFDPLVCRNGP